MVLPFRADRLVSVASLALIVVAALLPMSPVAAEGAPEDNAASPSPDGASPADVLAGATPGAPKDSPASDSRPAEAPATGGSMSTPAADNPAYKPANPSVTPPSGEMGGPAKLPNDDPYASDGVTRGLYGPPAPKAERGKLADIGWPEAPSTVPPALEAAVNIVTRNYPSAKSGRAALRAAAADVRSAQWLRFPSLSANLAYLDDSRGAQPQITLDQPIWTGGRITSNIRRARAAETAQSAAYVGVVEELALTTTDTYFQIATLTRREQLLAESLREHLRLVQTMERRVAQEVSPNADLELARSRAAQIEQDYTNTQAQRQTALRVLAEFIADPSYDLGPLPVYDPEIQLPARDALEEQSVAFDPNLKRLTAEADVARAEYDSRKAAILPQLSAQYTHDEFFGSRVGLAVRAQSSGGLSQFSEVNGARLRIDSALEARRQAELRLRREIASDVIQYDAAKARASISTRASATASNVADSYMRQFIAGRRSWLDVMNALREAVNAQIGKADAEQAALSAAVRLTLRSGRWRPNFTGPEQREADERQPAMAAM